MIDLSTLSNEEIRVLNDWRLSHLRNEHPYSVENMIMGNKISLEYYKRFHPEMDARDILSQMILEEENFYV